MADDLSILVMKNQAMVLSVKLNWLGIWFLLHFSRSLELKPTDVISASEYNHDGL